MPTLPLHVQQDGFFLGWMSLVGALRGYEAVDDSDGTTHDADMSYFILPKLLPGGTVSFPMFRQYDGPDPISIMINVVARQGGATHPRIRVGFYRGGVTAFSGTMFDAGADWTLGQTIFSTNPITAAPWSLLDMPGLEVCLQSEGGVNGNNDVTLISGSLEYIADHSYIPDPEPHGLALS